MKIAISAESTIDLTKELINEFDIKTVPFSLCIGEKIFKDGDLTTDEIIKASNCLNVLPKTSSVNIEEFRKHFENILKDYDAIIHFSLSSELSSAYNNAVLCSKEYNNVYIINTKNLSTGIALLVFYALDLIKDGLDVKSIVKKCNESIDNVRSSFVLDRLDYLYKCGRCSYLKMLGANLIKIKPQINVENGKMFVYKRYRGNIKSVIDLYFNTLFEDLSKVNFNRVFITYTTFDAKLIDEIKDKLARIGFDKIYVTQAGGTITSHCGENCFGILFMVK